MAENQNDKQLDITSDESLNDDDGFEVSDQGQNIGGKGDERKIDVGEVDGSGDDFNKTDQSITQAAPGQTMDNTNQGGSNA